MIRVPDTSSSSPSALSLSLLSSPVFSPPLLSLFRRTHIMEAGDYPDGAAAGPFFDGSRSEENSKKTDDVSFAEFDVDSNPMHLCLSPSRLSRARSPSLSLPPIDDAHNKRNTQLLLLLPLPLRRKKKPRRRRRRSKLPLPLPLLPLPLLRNRLPRTRARPPPRSPPRPRPPLMTAKTTMMTTRTPTW